jgi:hypothetical protein
MKHLVLVISFLCGTASAQHFPAFNPALQKVADIPLPSGFERIPLQSGSYADFLRHMPLRKDKTIYLYTGKPKDDQRLHYAVIDLSTGTKDLQQCADAVMRMRAEYFFAKKQFDSIRFFHRPDVYNFARENSDYSREQFMRFMEKVFINCGTYTLNDQLRYVTPITSMQVGDVLLKAGAPGHAETVVDMAVNKKTGQKIYLLAQGYMPAQDIHILLNPLSSASGPWHELTSSRQVITASWLFSSNQLRRW